MGIKLICEIHFLHRRRRLIELISLREFDRVTFGFRYTLKGHDFTDDSFKKKVQLKLIGTLVSGVEVTKKLGYLGRSFGQFFFFFFYELSWAFCF